MWKWMMVVCMALTAVVSAETKVLAFAGSTRDGSFNKKLVVEAANIAKQMGASVTVVDLKDYPLPFYDADLEARDKMPPQAKKLRQLMIQSQVILIASPEYNGSPSGILKNTIDWVSRSEEGGGSRDAFKGKKFLIMSTSPGQGGGAKGLVQLKAILEHIGATVVPQQIVIGDAYNAFDENGHLKNEKARKDLQQAVRSALQS